MTAKTMPNLFIVGAPKSGTTAMYEYLNGHPDIFMSPKKEPYYFGRDLRFHALTRLSSREYLRLFDNSTDERWIGEASVTYLYSRSAAEEIYKFNPAARIIVMLRNPIEMIHALHSQVLFSGIEEITDFEAALDAEEERRKGQRIPDNCTIVDFLFYTDFARYHLQLERYLRLFGAEQVHVILFDDFRQNIELAYKNTLAFLDADPEKGVKEFPRINRHKTRQNGWLHPLLNNELIARGSRLLLPSRQARQRLVDSLTVQYGERAPLSPELRERLRVEFTPGIRNLSRLIGRDLSHWHQSGAAQ